MYGCIDACLCQTCAPTSTVGLLVCVLQLMDRDPQMAQMLNNPELLRESFNMMANPVSVHAVLPASLPSHICSSSHGSKAWFWQRSKHMHAHNHAMQYSHLLLLVWLNSGAVS